MKPGISSAWGEALCVNVVDSFLQDLRYGLRIFRKSPAFTAVAVLSLALGIGANTAIFTLVNAVLLRDLPVRQPDRLVEVSAVWPDSKAAFSYPMFRELERSQRVFSGLIGWDTEVMYNVEVNGELTQPRGLSVTGNYYSELGVSPLLGRLLTPQDVDPHAGQTSQVAVIGYEFWQRRFGGAPDVVGKDIRIGGKPFTIIGVTRKWFTGMTTGEPPEITIPITAFPSTVEDGEFDINTPRLLWLSITGRLKDGVSVSQARSQLQSFWPQVLEVTVPTDASESQRARLLSMKLEVAPVSTGLAPKLRSQFSRSLYALAGIVALILLVACVNLANLMLARAAARRHEMGVRVALGAARSSIIRQVLTESLMLSFAGALLGLAFAYWGSRLLVHMTIAGNLLPVSLDLNPDLRVLCLTMSAALLTGILFGFAPAWRCSREDPALVLQQNSHSIAKGTGKLGEILIVSQIALSLVLLLGAGLLIKSFERLRSADLGFEKERILEIQLFPKPGGYKDPDMYGYLKQLLDKVSGIPGVSSVAYSRADVTGRAESTWREYVSVAPGDPTTEFNVKATGAIISPGFFATMGLQILRGRSFDETDDDKHPHHAIINSSLAERLFPNGDAIGKRVRFGSHSGYQNLEIVGIARNARIFDRRDPTTSVIYVPAFQFSLGWGYLFVRTKLPSETLVKTIGNTIESVGHEYPVWTKTIQQVLSEEMVDERVTAMLSGFFAAVALLLASIGLYGLMSFAVTRRTREFGVRAALGAMPKTILWMVLRETLTLALFGVAMGIPCALAITKLLASMLFGLSSNDVPTIAAVCMLLLAIAAIAGYLPARRASAISPMDALRCE